MTPLWPILGVDFHDWRVLLVFLKIITFPPKRVSTSNSEYQEAARSIENLHRASFEDSDAGHTVGIGDHDTSAVATIPILDRVA